MAFFACTKLNSDKFVLKLIIDIMSKLGIQTWNRILSGLIGLGLWFVGVFPFALSAQYIDRQKNCTPDTISIELFKSKHEGTTRYRAIECARPSYLGLRIDGGFSGYSYRGSTKAWFENKIVPTFGFALAYKNWNFGTRVKYHSFNPRVNYTFDREILNQKAQVISNKSDWYIGYSLNAKNLISFEPYLSYSVDNFRVKNQAALGQAFTMFSARGVTGGLSINRYVNIGGYEYFSVFMNLAYSMVDYTRTHPSLGKGYVEMTLGVAYKGFYLKQFMEKVQ
jgi:hypothetical protein